MVGERDSGRREGVIALPRVRRRIHGAGCACDGWRGSRGSDEHGVGGKVGDVFVVSVGGWALRSFEFGDWSHVALCPPYTCFVR